MFASLALAASAASCSTGEPTPPPDPMGYGAAGAATGGSASSGGSAGMHGGTSGAGGSSGAGVQGGSGGTLMGSGGTGTGGSGTGGAVTTGGSAGVTTGGSSGTGSSSGGMSSGGASSGGTGFGFGGRVGTGGGGGMTNAGRGSGGTSSAGTSSAGTSSSGGSGGSGGGVAPPPNISNGSKGWASRYWDCCKPACGWSSHTGGSNPMKSCDKSNNTLSDVNATNACDGTGGPAFMCWDDAPWQVGDQLSYGFIAAPQDKFTCGRCYHLQFDGGTHNGGMQSASASLNGKHMIVQVINNGGVATDQFDLLIPGGGVGALNACTSTGDQLGSVDIGAQNGGILTECNGDTNCTKMKCQTAFAGKQGLLDGCNWFVGWYAGADNPSFSYQQIACPSEITNKSGLRDPG